MSAILYYRRIKSNTYENLKESRRPIFGGIFLFHPSRYAAEE
jgi:hypothetical protein